MLDVIRAMPWLEMLALAIYLCVGLFGLVAGGLEIWRSSRDMRFGRLVRRHAWASKMEYAEVKLMAERYGQTRKSLRRALLTALGSSFGRSSGEEERKYVTALLAEHEGAEPFVELPEHIRMQLQLLDGADGASSKAVRQLAASLGEIYEKNRRDLVVQRRLTMAGFVFGVLGFGVGVYPLLFK